MLRAALAATTLLLIAAPANAGNITNQQTCQLTAEHVVSILESRDWKDEASDDIAVLNGFIAAQGTVIDREIAESAKAMSMSVDEIRTMVDQQGTAIAAQIDSRYGSEKLYRDYAVSLFNCAKLDTEALGTTPETFVATLERIGEWAQAGK
jgi:hypothetical protein